MKILRVISSMHPKLGGPSQGIRNSIPELLKLGIINEVLCLDNPNEQFIQHDPFIIHAIGAHSGPWRYNGQLLPWLRDNLYQYDAVIIHGLWLYHSYAVTRAIKECRNQNLNEPFGKPVPKLYVMPHGMLDPYFQNAPGRRLKAIRNWLYWKLIEEKVVNSADGILFTCILELELARIPFNPYRPKREINIGYGVAPPPPLKDVDHNEFMELYPDLKQKPFLLFLSRIHEKKGVDLLIQAYAHLVEKEPDLPMLVIAGPGMESAYGEKLSGMVEGNKRLESLIIFPGMLQGELKWGAFYGCDAFILPSHQENFGISVAEALACSAPVLISDQVNIWQEIKQGNAGFVEGDTFEGVILLLKSWLSLSKADKLAMKSSAKNTFETHFAIEPAAKRLAEEFLKGLNKLN